MHGKNLVGAATRFIAGRNAAQTVYWRSTNDQQKFMKVSKTVQFSKAPKSEAKPPAWVTEEQNIRF